LCVGAIGGAIGDGREVGGLGIGALGVDEEWSMGCECGGVGVVECGVWVRGAG
jgi:hypothetical protein